MLPDIGFSHQDFLAIFFECFTGLCTLVAIIVPARFAFLLIRNALRDARDIGGPGWRTGGVEDVLRDQKEWEDALRLQEAQDRYDREWANRL